MMKPAQYKKICEQALHKARQKHDNIPRQVIESFALMGQQLARTLPEKPKKGEETQVEEMITDHFKSMGRTLISALQHTEGMAAKQPKISDESAFSDFKQTGGFAPLEIDASAFAYLLNRQFAPRQVALNALHLFKGLQAYRTAMHEQKIGSALFEHFRKHKLG